MALVMQPSPCFVSNREPDDKSVDATSVSPQENVDEDAILNEHDPDPGEPDLTSSDVSVETGKNGAPSWWLELQKEQELLLKRQMSASATDSTSDQHLQNSTAQQESVKKKQESIWSRLNPFC